MLSSFILNVAYCLSLPEGPRCHGAKTSSADCCFQRSFLLGNLPYALASETGWPSPCLTNEWLVSSLPGEAKKQLVFSVLKEIASATGSVFWFLGGSNAS